MSGFIRETETVMQTVVTETEIHIVKIENFQKDLLTAYPEQSILTFKSDEPGGITRLQMDINTDVVVRENGVPVVISCSVGSKTYLLCVESDSVILKESKVPQKFKSETSEFIFYRRDVCNKLRSFESSVKSGFFLACCEDGDLKLQSYDEDKLDKFAAFSIVTEERKLQPGKYTFIEGFKAISCQLLNSQDELLVAHPEVYAATFKPDRSDAKVEQATFVLSYYNEYADTKKGIPMAISCEVDDKTYLLFVENNSVILKESKLPTEIETKTSELIFYRTLFSSGQSSFRFESSFTEKHCLAWNVEGPEKKLILKPYSKNDIDETMKFDLLV